MLTSDPERRSPFLSVTCSACIRTTQLQTKTADRTVLNMASHTYSRDVRCAIYGRKLLPESALLRRDAMRPWPLLVDVNRPSHTYALRARQHANKKRKLMI